MNFSNLKKTGKNLFLDQKSRVEILIFSIYSLNEQVTNNYTEVDDEEEIIKHNENETLYRLRVSQYLCKLKVVKNDVTTEAEGLKFSYYSVTHKLKCSVFYPDRLNHHFPNSLNFYKEFEKCVLSTEVSPWSTRTLTKLLQKMLEQILEATHYKTAVAQPLTSHFTDNPSKTKETWATAEEVGTFTHRHTNVGRQRNFSSIDSEPTRNDGQ